VAREEEWRILAEEAAQEKDPDKLMLIIEALNRALDDQERHKGVDGALPPEIGLSLRKSFPTSWLDCQFAAVR